MGLWMNGQRSRKKYVGSESHTRKHFKKEGRNAWAVQSVKHLTLDFRWGSDLAVREIEPRVGLCDDSGEPAWDSLSPSLSAPSLHVLSLSLSFSLSK